MIRTVVHSALAIIIFFVGGCYPPQPPVAVNARFLKNESIFSVSIYSYQWEPGHKGDVCLLACCKEVKDYTRTVGGNWVYNWMVINWEIIEVTRGKWTDDYLRFICYISWPTAESGIVEKVPLFPYKEGKVFHFCLDTSEKPALIVRQEERNSEPPYKRIGKPSWKIRDAVIASVKSYLRREKGPNINRIVRIVEEKDDDFVVEYIEGIENRLSGKVLVDKDTFEVRRISPP